MTLIDLLAIVTADGIGVALTSMLLLSVWSRRRLMQLGGELFVAMAVLTMLLCILEAASFCLDGRLFPGARVLNILANLMCFSLNMVFCVVWNLYIDYVLFEDASHVRRCLLRIMAPAIVVIILSIASAFTPIVFWVSDQNVYSRTAITTVPFVITYAYLGYSVLKVTYYRHRIDKYLLLPVAIFMLPILVASMLQFLFYGISLIWVACAISLVTLYINVQDEANAIDPLSGLYSRSYMMAYLNSMVSHARDGQLYAGLMLDVDRFKDINDTYGHAVGDIAITSTGQILRSAVDKTAFVARYAGDEFVVIAPVDKPEDADALVKRIEDAAVAFDGVSREGYSLRFSIGSTIFEPDVDTIETFLKRMDDAMYERKVVWARDHDRRHRSGA